MKTILGAIAIGLAIVAGTLFFLLENPDRFKPQITALVANSTGYQLDISGELAWRYWPPLAIQANGLALSTGGESFATFEKLEADIDLIPLLTGQRALNIERVAISGGNVLIRIDKSGQHNWRKPKPGATSQQNAPSPEAATSLDSLIPTLQELDLRDINVAYVDERTGDEYTAVFRRIQTGAIKAEKPFNAAFSFRLNDATTGTQLSVSSTGRFQINGDGSEVGFDETVTTLGLLIDNIVLPITNITSSGRWRADNQNVVLNQFDLQAEGLQATLSGLVNLANSEPRASGIIHLESAAPQKLSQIFDVDLPVSFFSLDSDFTATPSELQLKAFEGQFDNSRIKGSLKLSTNDKTSIKSEVRIDRLNLDDYFSAAGDSLAAGASSAAGAQTEQPLSGLSVATNPSSQQTTDIELIPVELLRELELNVIARVEQLIFEGYEFSQAKVELKNQRNQLETITNAKGFGGKFVISTETSLDSPVTTDLQISMDELDLTKLTEWESFSGTMTGTSSLRVRGANLNDFQTSTQGKTIFNVSDGQLDVRVIKNLAQTIGTIRGKRSSISDWPDVMPFDEMNGQHVFNHGFLAEQVLTAKLDNLSITALGGFDLPNDTAAYNVTAMFTQTETGHFKVSDQLSGVRWPLVCEGSLTLPIADLCFGREGAVNDLIADIVKQNLSRRGEQKIDDIITQKVPDEIKELTRDFFKDIFKTP
ncbi:MAG: AsmA protein [Candidatus Azotimanducaceae bacterium]|jgi:AsmA protein